MRSIISSKGKVGVFALRLEFITSPPIFYVTGLAVIFPTLSLSSQLISTQDIKEIRENFCFGEEWGGESHTNVPRYRQVSGWKKKLSRMGASLRFSPDFRI